MPDYDAQPTCGKCRHWHCNPRGRLVGHCDRVQRVAFEIRWASDTEVCGDYAVSRKHAQRKGGK